MPIRTTTMWDNGYGTLYVVVSAESSSDVTVQNCGLIVGIGLILHWAVQCRASTPITHATCRSAKGDGPRPLHAYDLDQRVDLSAKLR